MNYTHLTQEERYQIYALKKKRNASCVNIRIIPILGLPWQLRTNPWGLLKKHGKQNNNTAR
jgi:hypothetical protein